MNIVIADDEEIILKWLKKNIEALSPDYCVIDTFANGKQVLNCCLNHQVDVLITDIRMPIMDGMQLLKKLNQNYILPYTIVLSAYDDFSYARECIKWGVSEFLLKSEITKEEIEQCLRRAGERIKINEAAEGKDTSPGEEMEMALQQYFNDTDYASKDILEQTWRNCCRIREKYAIITIHETKRITNQEQLREIVPISFQEDKRTIYWIPKNEREMIVLMELMAEVPQITAEKIYRAIASFCRSEVYVSSSGAGITASELDLLYRQSQEVLEYQLFYKHTGGLDYEAMKKSIDHAEIDFVQKLEKLELLISNHAWNGIQEVFNALFEYIRKSEPEISYLRKSFLNLLLNMYWSYLNDTDRKDFSIDQIIEITNCTDIDQLERLVMIQVESLIRILIDKQKIYSDSILKIIQYIEERYADPITLEELANYVHMNRSYISYLFKKETGSNINTYLLAFRMDKAKELLKNSKNSVQDISCQLGIPDSAYFSKLFKRYTGISPLEFRRISNER